MWMRCPMGSIWSNSSSASFWLTTATWAAAASSTSVNERPGDTSAWPPSSSASQLTDGSCSITLASSSDIGGLRRHGLISSDPSETFTPPWKNRPTQKVLGPDCSSMSAMPLLKPLMIAPITITTMTPIATPRIVRAARALWARSDSSAMPTPSSKGVKRSLLAQRRDGIEPGRPAGRIHARHDADPAADHDAQQDRERRYRGGQGGRDLQEQRERDPGPDPQGRAHRGEGRGLGEELAQDVPAPGAERLADADLAGPLRDRHQHDVHDHDAADHERDAHQSGPDDVEDPAELLPEIEHALRGFHHEVVVLTGAQMPAAAHDGFGLVHRVAHFELGVRLHDQGVDHAGRVHLALYGRERRGDHELVERDAEQVALALHHPDHPIGNAVDPHGATDRVDAGEQLLRQIVPEHHDGRPRLRLLGRERAAVRDL